MITLPLKMRGAPVMVCPMPAARSARPEQLAGLGVQRDQPAVEGGDENPPVVIGNAAVDGEIEAHV